MLSIPFLIAYNYCNFKEEAKIPVVFDKTNKIGLLQNK